MGPLRRATWSSFRSHQCLLLVLMWCLPAWADEQIAVGLGMNKVLTIPGLLKMANGNPKIIDVTTMGGNQVLITGMQEGKTSLTVWKTSGQRTVYVVSVSKKDPGQVISEIKKLMGEIEGVRVELVGDRIILDGQAYTQADADRINEVVALYVNQDVKSFVKVAPNAKRLVAQSLNAAFQKGGLKHVQANVVGATIFLEGSVESPEDLRKAELITKAVGEKVESLLVVGIKRMILSEVQFVEIRRQGKDRGGIKYPTDITGTAAASLDITKQLFPGDNPAEGHLRMPFTASSAFAIVAQLNDGYARLLAQPKLVCASGEKAEFVAGGEIPIPLITNNQFTVEYKPYGIILKLQPTADRNGNIQTLIEAEVSQIDTQNSVTTGGISVPGFLTRKVKTNVTVRHGETIVLSGVFSDDQQKFVSKLPGLGNIPILGELFKNRAFDSNKLELVIYVTPRIVNPDSDRILKIIDDVRTRYKQAKSEVLFNIFD